MRRHLCILAVLTSSLAGCDCGDGQTNTTKGELTFSSDMQFGVLGVGETLTREAKLKNVGTAEVVVERFEVTGPFKACLRESDGTCGKSASLGVAEERLVDVTYAPTEPNPDEETNHQGDITAVNDTAKPRLTIHVVGHAVPTRLTVDPARLDFGDVEVGGAKEIALTLENRGLDPVEVTEATLDSSAFTVDLAALKARLARGAKVSTPVKYAPKAGQSDAAVLALTTNLPLQPKLEIPLTGKGLLEKVSFCFGFEGETQTCLPDAQGRVSGLLDFGALDDKAVKKATVTLKNEGNVQVELLGMAGGVSTTSDETARRNPCALAAADLVPDFTFVPTAFGAKLPEDGPGAPLTQSLSVEYSPTYHCALDTSDSGVVSVKAGTGPKSPWFRLDLRGYSKVGLVKVNNVSWNVATVVVKDYKVFNTGSGPLQVTKVEFTEGLGDRDCDEGCATRVACSKSTSLECSLFSWATGPTPVQVPAAAPNSTTEAVVGSVQYSAVTLCPGGTVPDGGVCSPKSTVRVCVRVSTSDPFHPEACGELEGTAF